MEETKTKSGLRLNTSGMTKRQMASSDNTKMNREQVANGIKKVVVKKKSTKAKKNTNDAIQYTPVREAEETLMRDLAVLSNRKDANLFQNNLTNVIIRTISTNRDLYAPENQSMVINLFKNFVTSTSGQSKNQEVLMDMGQRLMSKPFFIFDKILNMNASDIFILENKISFTERNNQSATEIKIPRDLIPAYQRAVDAFIEITKYASSKTSSTKFDPTNAILDYSVEDIRFNVAHSSLNASMSDRPIISLRKQIMKTADNSLLGQEYIEDVGCTPSQIDFINELSYNKSYCVFGETGSGKTTMLKYMGAYRISDKRNLVTIEDTPELFLPVNISYLTNEKFNIKDLFTVTLRENPSHIIVGETRTDEIVDILESGLVFSVGTSIHADSLEKLIMRIVFMVKKAKADYSTEDINTLISSVMDGFIYMKNRRVVGVWKRKPIDEIGSTMDRAILNYEPVQ